MGISATARLWRQSAAMMAGTNYPNPAALGRPIYDEETARRLILEANPPAIEAGRSDAEAAR